jgi:sialate O-acetylesterase
MQGIGSRVLMSWFFLMTGFAAHSEVRLPQILGDHMVLQRDAPIHIWGWAEPSEQITVSMHGQSRATAGDDLGQWSVYLPSMHAGGPFELSVQGTNKVTLSDILIGDVWFASGQSNMEMPLSGFPGNAVVKDADHEIAQANLPQVRLLHVAERSSDWPVKDIVGSWSVCTPETAAQFSAVAYFFGREIQKREHVPIGLIDSSWGGTPAEAWISLEGLGSNASLMPVFAARAHFMEQQNDMSRITDREKREDEVARQSQRPLAKHPWHPRPESWAPAGLFNGMVAPATPFSIKGVIWYQGESNSRAILAPLYEKVFPTLIADWRAKWQEGNFPFLFVQISSYTSDSSETWGLIREAQRRTLSVANTAMAVTLDVGDPDNVHPADKQAVGGRLALAARAVAYGESVEYSGPLLRSATPDGGNMNVWFDHATGLVSRGATLNGFEIAGRDKRFVTGTARIEDDHVVVESSEIAKPLYVRYGWANAPVANLFNAAGLPASTFTSEDEAPAPTVPADVP